MDGVTVILCCHNSAARVREALRYLAMQTGTGAVPWEVVVVDNASRDNTAELARAGWQGVHTAPLRVVNEPQPGLAFARRRGISEARYRYLTFIDDDNWVAPDWVETVRRIFDEQPRVGILNGVSEPVFDGECPAWFSRFQTSYAVSPPDWKTGDITEFRGWLWGAGLSLRRQTWDDLVAAGWQWQLTGRRGSALNSGEDSELCLAAKAAGWRLWYDPRLRLRHHIPAARLEWSYLRRVSRASGEASVIHDLYRSEGRAHWWRAVAGSLKTAVGAPLGGIALIRGTGSWRVLSMDRELGRLSALWRLRREYPQLAATIGQTCRRLAERPNCYHARGCEP
jgi:glycosyltransferase involved in cell wall biosynthesis